MQPYSVRAAEVACGQIVLQVLLSESNDDLEFVAMHSAAQPFPITREDFAARKLRSVGVIGLRGLAPARAFKEPLAPSVVDGISTAFLVYVQTVLGNSFHEHAAKAELTELERMFALPDPRPYPHPRFQA